MESSLIPPLVSPPPEVAPRRTGKRRLGGKRACDACSIRKVRCDVDMPANGEPPHPCSHCLSNGLKCTLVRQRKKLGPKNLHKKTLKLIHTLVPVTDAPQPPEADDRKAFILSPTNLHDQICVVLDEPIVFELIKPFTPQLVVVNLGDLLTFVLQNFTSAMDKEINVMDRHNDNTFLSKLLVVLTLNLLIAEILIKLKKQKYNGFSKYPKRLIQERNFKNFKNLTHFKCIEVVSLIEKNFIVPPVIPAQHIPVLGAQNTFSVYYNLLLGYYHMCTYYHILNLTNIMNGGDTPTIGHYGNEQQEQQKLLFLRRSMSYFQLLNIKSAPDHLSAAVQVYEMFDMLYTWERYMLLYSLTTYALAVYRNNDIILQLDRDKFRTKHNISNAFDKNVLYALIGAVEKIPGLMENMAKLSFQSTPQLTDQQTPYDHMKKTVQSLSQDNVFEVIKQVFLFKMLCVYGHWNVQQELDEQLLAVTNILKGVVEMDLFKVKMLNFQLLPHILHMLRVRLDLSQVPPNRDMLVMLSDCLIPHFSHFNNINKLIRANSQLNEWFLSLNQMRTEIQVGQVGQVVPPPPPVAIAEPVNQDWDLPMSELLNNLFSLFNQISEDSANVESFFALSPTMGERKFDQVEGNGL